MTAVRVSRRAGERLDEIYLYTAEQSGEDQADTYARGLIERFGQIAARSVPWRRVPAEFGLDGYLCRYEHHYIYWKVLADGDVGIVTVLHERMHQIEGFVEDWG